MNDLALAIWQQLIAGPDGLQVSELCGLNDKARSTIHSSLANLLEDGRAEKQGIGNDTHYIALVPQEWEQLADAIKKLAVRRRKEELAALVETGEWVILPSQYLKDKLRARHVRGEYQAYREAIGDENLMWVHSTYLYRTSALDALELEEVEPGILKLK